MFEIQLYNQTIDNTVVETVSGREMWEALEIKRDKTDWLKYQIESLQLVENVEYIINHKKGENPLRGRPSSEYFFTLDIAKHIALASRTPKGREYRQALIDLEKSHFKPSANDRVSMIKDIYSFMQEHGLVDGHVEMIAREQLANLMRGSSNQIEAPKHFATEDFFEYSGMTPAVWKKRRSSVGKLIKRVIQEAHPDAEPIKIQKDINGSMRTVNGWPMAYWDLAKAAVEALLG